jgi:uncharacterized RDD family membrane protein YckC
MRYCKNCGNELPEEAKFCPKCGTAVAIEEPAQTTASPVVPAAPVAPEGLKLAFWWERFVAWLIDIILVGIVTSILGLFSLLGGLPNNFTLVPGWPDWLSFFFSLNINGVILFLYWMLMEGMYGQSLGKMIMRIKVTRLDGSPAGVTHAVVESVGKAFLLPPDLLLGWLLYSRRRQRIFNYISGTIVIKVT